MAAIRVRLLGGALNGHVLWVEEGRAVLQVNMATGTNSRTTVQYRIDGNTGHFVPEPVPVSGEEPAPGPV